jgi:hypothetical protein
MKGEEGKDVRKSLAKNNPFVEEELEDAWLKATYTEREPLGEERFALRVLVNGITAIVEPTLCGAYNRARHTGGKRALQPRCLEDPMLVRQQEALEWISGGETGYPFEAVCNTLRLDAERLRDALFAKWERLRKQIEKDEKDVKAKVPA